MLDIASGAVRAYYLFDVADTIDLAKTSALGVKSRAPAAPPRASVSSVSGPPARRELARDRFRRAALFGTAEDV
jgi:hypothetical protein